MGRVLIGDTRLADAAALNKRGASPIVVQKAAASTSAPAQKQQSRWARRDAMLALYGEAQALHIFPGQSPFRGLQRQKLMLLSINNESSVLAVRTSP